MTTKDYGIEDICVSLDSIEKQLKRIVALEKLRQKTTIARAPEERRAVDEI